MPDFENVSDSSSDHCDDDSTNASRESATAYGGKGNRGKRGDAVRTRGVTEGAVGRGRGRGRRGRTVRDIRGTEGAGVQEGTDQRSAVLRGGIGRGRGQRGTARDKIGTDGAGDHGGGDQELSVACSGRGRPRGRSKITARGRQAADRAGDQGKAELEGSAVVFVGKGRGRGRRGCTVRDIGGTEGVGDQAGDAGSTCKTAATGSVVARNSVNPVNLPTMLTSKKGDIVWMTQPIQPATGRHTAQNVMHIKPGPTRFAMRNVDSPKSAFELFMRGPVLNEIEKWTNAEGKNVFADNWKDVTTDELLRYLGILILIGVYRSKNEPISELWSRERGRPIISGSMARDRFQQISRVLRFDDASTRRQRRTTDKLAPIRTVFDVWQATLEDAFVPFENVTVDEQLLTYRGRCPFIQYIPSKPGKYGIKFWMLCDSKTSYVSRVQVYTGRLPEAEAARETKQGQRVVQELCKNLVGSGRNVTCDNFFTSLELIQNLKKNKMTLLGVAFVQEKRTERLRYIVLNVAKLLAKNMLKPCVTIALDSASTSEEDVNNSRDRCLIYIRSLIYI
jgi:hypothetical protein